MSRDEKLIAEARALVETWRQYVKRCETAANNGFDQDWSLVNCTRQCADELEALLAEPAEPPSTEFAQVRRDERERAVRLVEKWARGKGSLGDLKAAIREEHP